MDREKLTAHLGGILEMADQTVRIEELEHLLRTLQKTSGYVENVISNLREKEAILSNIEENESEVEANAVAAQAQGSYVTGSTTISSNDVNYGLIRFPRGLEIVKQMSSKSNSKITVDYKGEKYELSIPNQENIATQGRINGARKIYKKYPNKFTPGTQITMKLSLEDGQWEIIDPK